MTREIVIETVKGIIAIVVVGAAFASYAYPQIAEVAIPLATFVIGYYFKSNERVILAGAKRTLGIKPKQVEKVEA